ncbi:MAG: DUF222 domain-containing protein, partial [Actinomycetota bacterium]|nr:DUF222 domain-containing protein [Actinomycetota bacterium]
MGKGEINPIVIPRLGDHLVASADERDEQLMLLEAARNLLDVEWTETLAASEANEDHHIWGYPSTVAYLKDRCGMSGSRAHRYTKLARAANRFKATLSSWKHRLINSDQAELLFRASERLPDKYPDAEPVLLEMVAGDHPDETRKTLDYWTQTVDRDPMDLDSQLERRRLDYARKANGMVEGDFAFPQLAGETFITALDALMPPPAEGDERTPSQRRADAGEDLARAFLEGSQTPEVGGEKPHLNVHVDEPALEGTPGGLHETETGTVVTMTTIRQLACDASISRIVWNPASEIIDIGRKTRVIPAATRRAVIARDRHCVVAGCGRSPRWCDVHHIIHWADG